MPLTPIEKATNRVHNLARARAKVRKQLAYVKQEEARLHREYLAAHCALLRLQVERDEWALRSTEPYVVVYDSDDEQLDQDPVRPHEPPGDDLGDVRGPTPEYWLADPDSIGGGSAGSPEAGAGQGRCAGSFPEEEARDEGEGWRSVRCLGSSEGLSS